VIAYLDTSAVVPLLIAGPGSARAATLWDGADREEIDLVEVDDALVRRAGELAEVRQLRGHDAVHLAAADRVHDPNVVLIAGDRALLDAATAEGMTVAELP
jgi:predicted nucleic acid-binding protein